MLHSDYIAYRHECEHEWSTSVTDHQPIQVYPASHPGAGSAPAPHDPAHDKQVQLMDGFVMIRCFVIG